MSFCTVCPLNEPLHSLHVARAPTQSPCCTSPYTVSLLHELLHSLPFARAPAQSPCCTSPCKSPCCTSHCTVSLLDEPQYSLPVARTPAQSPCCTSPKQRPTYHASSNRHRFSPTTGHVKHPLPPHDLFSITTHSMLLKQPLPFARPHDQVEARGGTVPGCTSPCTASMSSTRP